MKHGVVATFAAAALAACAGPTVTPTPSPAQTWIAVRGPMDWIVPEEMRLEIGESAWAITADGGGGVVTPDISSATEVRLFGVADCRLYASFAATPGSAHLIRFAEDGSFIVEDWTGQALELGPGLVDREPSGCQGSAVVTLRAGGNSSVSVGRRGSGVRRRRGARDRRRRHRR